MYVVAKVLGLVKVGVEWADKKLAQETSEKNELRGGANSLKAGYIAVNKQRQHWVQAERDNYSEGVTKTIIVHLSRLHPSPVLTLTELFRRKKNRHERLTQLRCIFLKISPQLWDCIIKWNESPFIEDYFVQKLSFKI